MTDKYFKPCECGCGEMIPTINKLGKPARFKNHHNIKIGTQAIHWKGGRTTNSQGYVLLYSPMHPYRNKQGYVREHRLAYEKYLTQLNKKITYLPPSVEIDHIDGNRQNNNLNNLRIFTKKQHMSMHKLSGIIIPINERVCYICKSNYTLKRKGTDRPCWYRYHDNVICHRCYCKTKRKVN
jgi:hypothetical protein